MKIYVIGSLRKPEVEEFADTLRGWGDTVFDQWRAAGPKADDEWRDYFKRRKVGYKGALESPFVEHIVEFDKRWLTWANVVITHGAPGVSSAYELMWAGMMGKLPIIYLPQDPERWDAMALLVPHVRVATSLEELAEVLDEEATAREHS